MPVVGTVKVPVELRPRRRLRLRLWWERRRMTPAQRDLADRFERSFEESVLLGKGPIILPPCPHVTLTRHVGGYESDVLVCFDCGAAATTLALDFGPAPEVRS